ncbi:hypothetical protein [Mucilaginibacter sp.]
MSKLTQYQSFQELKADSGDSKVGRGQSKVMHAEMQAFFSRLRIEHLKKQLSADTKR